MAAPLSREQTDAPVVRRDGGRWHVVGGGEGDGDADLLPVLVLADLLVPPGPTAPRPAAATGDDEVARLRATVRQLEHALSTRVVVERAIGALAERHGTTPRQAFEALRREARATGRRVHVLAEDVVEGLGRHRE